MKKKKSILVKDFCFTFGSFIFLKNAFLLKDLPIQISLFGSEETNKQTKNQNKKKERKKEKGKKRKRVKKKPRMDCYSFCERKPSVIAAVVVVGFC